MNNADEISQAEKRRILANDRKARGLSYHSVAIWVTSPAYMPASGWERAIWIKDLGGFAATFAITIQPFAGQFIDLLSSFQILENRQLVRLFPIQDSLSGWYSG